MGRTIKVKLSTRSINSAIRELEAYKSRLEAIRSRICEGLSKIGLTDASVRFASAGYDGRNDAEVTAEATHSGYKLIASGNAVAFIEFGTGVYYNKGTSYPIAKPSGIVGIGEYGKGQGKKDEWKYVGEAGTNGVLSKDGKVVITKGNPAQMPMYHALLAMQGDVERIAQEAFRNA